MTCPKCGGQMWDNRAKKTNPKAPDFKCKDKNCDGVIWPPKNHQNSPASVLGSPPAHQNSNGLDERQRAIIRQHSQSMALELLKLKATLGQLAIEDLSPAKLRLLSDYFDKDVLGSPLSQPHRPVGIDEPSSEDWPPDARYDNPLGTPI